LSNLNYSLDFELNDNNYISNLFGAYDKNIQIIEKINNVKIKYRGNKIKIIGTKSSIKNTKDEILKLFEQAKKGIDIDEDKILETKSMKILEINSDDQMNLFFQTKKRKILPRSQNQKKYFELLNTKDIVLAYGPAGTGKTFLAVAKAVASLQQSLVKKIILSRPAV
jgi:Phosphate starvation-inducible protein PhoH, predicted ATPase